MNKTLIVLLSSSLLFAAAPLVTADETHPDCEEGQDWISYNPSVNDAASAVGDSVFVCEGEHWDGEDPVSDMESSDELPCLNAAGVTMDPRNTHVSFCQGVDPNEGGAAPLSGKVVSFRVSTAGEDSNQEAYVATHVGGVGQVILYQGAKDGQGMTAVYLRDSTVTGVSDVNVLAQVVSAAGITKGYVSEEDCSHEHYQNAARAGVRDPSDPRACGRDNTAVTAEYLLP